MRILGILAVLFCCYGMHGTSVADETTGANPPTCEFSDPAVCDFIERSVSNALLRPSHQCLSGNVFANDKQLAGSEEDAMNLYMWESFIHANLPTYYSAVAPTPFKGRNYYQWRTLAMPWEQAAENFVFNWAQFPRQVDINSLSPPLVKSNDVWDCMGDSNCRNLFPVSKQAGTEIYSEVRFNIPLVYSSLLLSQDSAHTELGSAGYLTMGECGEPVTSTGVGTEKADLSYHLEPAMSILLHWIPLGEQAVDRPLDDYCHITTTTPIEGNHKKHNVWGLLGMDFAVKSDGHWSWNWASASIAADQKYCSQPSPKLLATLGHLKQQETGQALQKMNSNVRALLATQNSLLRHYEITGLQYVEKIVDSQSPGKLPESLSLGLAHCESFAQASLILPNAFITKDQQYAIPFNQFLRTANKSYSLAKAKTMPAFYNQKSQEFVSPIKEPSCVATLYEYLGSSWGAGTKGEFCNALAVGRIMGHDHSSAIHHPGKPCMGCHVTASISDDAIVEHDLMPTYADFVCSFNKTGVPLIPKQ